MTWPFCTLLSFALTVDGARANSFSSFEMVEGVDQNGVDAPKEQNGKYFYGQLSTGSFTNALYHTACVLILFSFLLGDEFNFENSAARTGKRN